MAIAAAIRRRIIELACGRCEYCRLPQSHSPSSFAVDHIQPRSCQGDDEIENLALCCPGCNGAKYNKTQAIDPATDALATLFHPRNQTWSDHFAWSEDELIVIGLTEVGRATIGALDLNREGAMNLRHVLIPGGWHPPNE